VDDLLNHFIGRWTLEGKMGDVDLHQDVSAEWVLKGLLLQIRFTSVKIGVGGNPDYDALYLVGRDEKTNQYVLHLFDTFGISSRPVAGIGTRKENSISFRFDYDSGPWFNTFSWAPGTGRWSNKITYEKDGKELTFAVKELTPK
jgi:hypothetical protein